jgi:hypothetical protein
MSFLSRRAQTSPEYSTQLWRSSQFETSFQDREDIVLLSMLFLRPLLHSSADEALVRGSEFRQLSEVGAACVAQKQVSKLEGGKARRC